MVERRDLILDVAVSGTLRSLAFEPVASPTSVNRTWEFKIIRIAPEAAQVKAGDEVIAFDTSDLEKLLQDDQSELQRISEEIEKSRAENALTTLEERKALADAESQQRKAELKADKPLDLTAAADLKKSALTRDLAMRQVAALREKVAARRQQLESSLAIAETRKSRAQRRVDELQAQLAAMSIRCKRSGTVIYKQNGRGEKKKVGDSVSRWETVLEVAALDQMAGQGQIDEVYGSQVAVGQRVGFRLEAHPDQEYAGVVERIAPIVRTESAESRIKIIQLDIKLAATDPLLMRPGMRFRGSIEISRSPKVLQIPIAAITSTASGPLVTRVGAAGALAPSPVKLGRRSRESVEVLGGLQAGEQVLLPAKEGEATGNESRGLSLGAS